MTIPNALLSTLALFTLAACSSSPGTGSSLGGAQNGGAQTTGGGASAVVGAASGGNATVTLNVADAGVAGNEGVMNGVCDQQDFDLQRKPAEILIVLDRSGSMKDPPTGSRDASKWDLVVPGVNQVVTATDSSVSWGLKVFPEGEGRACAAGSVTSAVTVEVAAANAQAVTDAVTATTPEGNGTPTGDAIDAAVTYLKTLTDTNPKFILLATDGEPSCAGTLQDSTAARTQAVQAVTAAAAAGFKTVVVGVATTKATATKALNDLATAGQMARTDSDPLATQFYLASTKDELVASLETITGQVSSCLFDLNKTPPDPDNIAVVVNGATAPRDPTHAAGWDYATSDDTQVEVFGSWCDQIKSADAKAGANTVTFKLGCHGETIR
ncbi:MAG: vWA domain-containing protein [Polyangiaceae bacterium]